MGGVGLQKAAVVNSDTGVLSALLTASVAKQHALLQRIMQGASVQAALFSVQGLQGTCIASKLTVVMKQEVVEKERCCTEVALQQ